MTHIQMVRMDFNSLWSSHMLVMSKDGTNLVNITFTYGLLLKATRHDLNQH